MARALLRRQDGLTMARALLRRQDVSPVSGFVGGGLATAVL